MGRRATWVVTAAIGLLASAAVADALRRAPDPAPRTARPVASRQTEAHTVASGLSGWLYYSDEHCRLRALELASMEEAPAPEWEECAFSLAPDGRSVVGAGVWQPQGTLRALVQDGFVHLVSDPARWETRFPGAAAAFKPSGITTFSRGRDIFELSRECPRGESPILLYGSGPPRCPRRIDRVAYPPTELVWLTENRFAAVLDREGEDAFVIWEDGRSLLQVPGWGGAVAGIKRSPGGRYVSTWSESRGLLVYRNNGTTVPLPDLTKARAIAWSPDDSWTAIATAASIFVFPSESREGLRRLPLTARAIEWVASPDVRG